MPAVDGWTIITFADKICDITAFISQSMPPVFKTPSKKLNSEFVYMQCFVGLQMILEKALITCCLKTSVTLVPIGTISYLSIWSDLPWPIDSSSVKHCFRILTIKHIRFLCCFIIYFSMVNVFSQYCIIYRVTNLNNIAFHGWSKTYLRPFDRILISR